MADLKDSSSDTQEDVNMGLAIDYEQAGRLWDIAIEYDLRYQLDHSSPSDLAMAIEIYEGSLKIMPHRAERTLLLEGLAEAYRNMFHLTGDKFYTERATRVYQAVLNSEIQTDDFDRIGTLLDFDILHQIGPDRRGVNTGLSKAIQMYRESLNSISPGHAEWPTRLETLGAAYHSRYGRQRGMSDLETAIQLYQRSLSSTPLDRVEWPARAHTLGRAHQDRYLAGRDIVDLDLGIQLCQQSLDRTSSDHPKRTSRIQSLGEGYHTRYASQGSIADLDKAIALYQSAVELHQIGSDKLPANRVWHTVQCQLLGNAYRDRYRETKNTADQDRAMQLYQECLRQTPPYHIDTSGRLQALAKIYVSRFEEEEKIEDFNSAVELYQKALDHSPSPVLHRIESGMSLIALQSLRGVWEEAYQAVDATVNLAKLLAARSLENQDKQRLLSSIAGLSRIAIAIGLNAGKHLFDTLRLFELSHGIIARSLNEIRTDIAELQRHHPKLAQEYIFLRDQLDAPARSTQTRTEDEHNPSVDLLHPIDEQELSENCGAGFTDNSHKTHRESRADLRQKASNRFNDLVDEIRKQPGFCDFLDVPGQAQIQAAAKQGPIVIINESELRCDAILIERHQIRSLVLPLGAEDMGRMVPMKGSRMFKALQWLWDFVAKPILEALGFTSSASGDIWPHVWWIPTGLFSRLPIHAAGYHDRRSSESVLDRVMSSYSTSVNAIVHGRRRSAEPISKKKNGALLLAMNQTVGNSVLPFASKEVATVHELCGSMGLDPIEPKRKRENVLSHLPDCRIFHFAGHGHTHRTDPSKSYLLLDDWKTNPLTVSALLDTNLQHHSLFLAYLSACGTGRVQNERFFGESIHLVNAFQLAGFRHVIGTLWDIVDQLCVDMARITYENIRDRGMNDESVCLALHTATRELRDRQLDGLEGSVGGGREKMKTVVRNKVGFQSSEYQKDNRLLRDAIPVDSDDDGDDLSGTSPYWAAYVHFGV